MGIQSTPFDLINQVSPGGGTFWGDLDELTNLNLTTPPEDFEVEPQYLTTKKLIYHSEFVGGGGLLMHM
jgi:hypothetical protein